MRLPAWTILLIVQEVVIIIAIISILLRPREPRAMLAWILTLLLLPGLGLVLLLVAGEPRRGHPPAPKGHDASPPFQERPASAGRPAVDAWSRLLRSHSTRWSI